MDAGSGALVDAGCDVNKEYMLSARVCGAIMSTLLLIAAAVEIIRHNRDCAGLGMGAGGRLTDIFYAIAFGVFLGVRIFRKQVLKNRPKDLSGRLKSLKIVSIVTFILCEAPAVLGAALFATGGFYREFYAFFLYSMLLMVLYFPRLNQWERWLNTGKGY